MKKILVLVEGQTEERFSKIVLYEYLLNHEVCLIPVIIRTKEVKNGPNYTGGINSYNNIKDDLLRLLKDTSAVCVTTLIDFYGLPRNFPSFELRGNCYQQVEAAEKAFSGDINNEKFMPYLQLHEFEGILFSVPSAIASTMDTSGKSLSAVQSIRDGFDSPEEINNSPDTHPSMRIRKLFPNYNKPFHGELISSRIGIQQLKTNCAHFSEWLDKLIAIS